VSSRASSIGAAIDRLLFRLRWPIQTACSHRCGPEHFGEFAKRHRVVEEGALRQTICGILQKRRPVMDVSHH